MQNKMLYLSLYSVLDISHSDDYKNINNIQTKIEIFFIGYVPLKRVVI